MEALKTITEALTELFIAFYNFVDANTTIVVTVLAVLVAMSLLGRRR